MRTSPVQAWEILRGNSPPDPRLDWLAHVMPVHGQASIHDLTLSMSLATVHSRALDGLAAAPVTVEVHLANGLPSFTKLER